MPRKVPFNFDVDAWMGDPGINLLRPSSRAAWFDALCRMHDRGRAGKLSGTIKDLAVLCRCTPTEMRLCVDELKLHDCADVTECHNTVTLTNRRMSREAEIRKSNRERKVKERDRIRHTNVTGDVTDLSHKCHANKSDGPPPPDGFSPLIPLSSLSPSPPLPAAENSSPSEPDPIRTACRQYLRDNPRLNWSQIGEDQLSDLVRRKGWAWTERAVEGCLDDREPNAIQKLYRRFHRGENGTERQIGNPPTKTIIRGER